MRKRVLFLAGVFVFLTLPVMADEVGFQGGTMSNSGSADGAVAVPSGLPGAVLFPGVLTGAHARRTVLGNGRSFGSIVEDSFDASSRRSFSSVVTIDNGAISISVPEPETMGTLATGLAMIVYLMGQKRRKFKAITKFYLH